MKPLPLIGCVLLLSIMASAKHDKDHGYVPNSQAAVDLGRAELTQVYGQKQIQSEEPLTAELEDGVWTVTGTLWCSDGKRGRTRVCNGGVATVKIRQSDGHVLSIWHTM